MFKRAFYRKSAQLDLPTVIYDSLQQLLLLMSPPKSKGYITCLAHHGAVSKW